MSLVKERVISAAPLDTVLCEWPQWLKTRLFKFRYIGTRRGGFSLFSQQATPSPCYLLAIGQMSFRAPWMFFGNISLVGNFLGQCMNIFKIYISNIFCSRSPSPSHISFLIVLPLWQVKSRVEAQTSQGTGTVLRIRLLPWLSETKMPASGLFNHSRKHHHPASRVSFCLLPAQGGERRLCACLNCVKP